MPQKQKLNGRKLNKQGLKYQYMKQKKFDFKRTHTIESSLVCQRSRKHEAMNPIIG